MTAQPAPGQRWRSRKRDHPWRVRVEHVSAQRVRFTTLQTYGKYRPGQARFLGRASFTAIFEPEG